MVVDYGKDTDAAEVVDVEEVATVKEVVVAIHIIPKTPGIVLTSQIFIGISAVPFGVLFRKTPEHILSANIAVEIMVTDAVTMGHAGNVAMSEDVIFHKLILISLNLAMEGLVGSCAVHRRALVLKEERIDS